MKNYLYGLLILAFVGCSEKQELPISEEKMALVLKEMLIAEAALNRVGRSVEDSLHKLYYEQIYQIHQIDSQQLAESFKMMQENPKLAKDLYDKAEELLVDLETSIK